MTAPDPMGWFSDTDPTSPDYDPKFPWQPHIQIPGSCPALTVWFATEDDCDQFIREFLVGAKLFPE